MPLRPRRQLQAYHVAFFPRLLHAVFPQNPNTPLDSLRDDLGGLGLTYRNKINILRPPPRTFRRPRNSF
jgi:hypothetical protein